MTRTIVVAVGSNLAIGKDNDLLWKLPDDFKFFKQTTLDHYILMGRKTYESLGKPLPGRVSVVITSNKDYQLPEGHHVVHSLEEALALAEKANQSEAMIIGGGRIYKESIEKGLVDKMYITEIEAGFEEADTYFPDFDKAAWEEVARSHHPADERHQYAFDFVTYLKK
jgi:dihydrofolate reductase